MAMSPSRSSPEPRRPSAAWIAERVRELACAVGFLTRVAIARDAPPERLARAVVFFPLLGIALAWIASGGGAAVQLLLAATGAAHPGGALGAWVSVLLLAAASSPSFTVAPASVATALRRRVDRAQALHMLRTRKVDVTGKTAVALLWLAKGAALALVAPGARAVALVLAVLLGRWSLVVQAFGSIPAAPSELPPPPMAKLEFREFALTSVLAMALTFAVADALGLALVLLVAVETVALRILVHRWLGGVTTETSITGGEIAETSVLLCCAALSRLARGG